ncbi:MAG: HlyD family efflux transporter periplasmic adaptor subunit [Litorimonas sp.]
MSELFRREVVEKQGKKLHGDVVLSSPVTFTTITALIVAIIIGLACVVVFGDYARKERVLGIVTPDKGLSRIVARQPGIIDRVHVEAGDTVTVGDPLFSIRVDQISSSGSPVAERLIEQLASERDELEARLDIIPRKYTLTRSRLRNNIAALLAEADRLDPRIEAQSKTVANERSVFDRLSDLLEEDAASSLEIKTQENRLLLAEQSLAILRGDKSKLIDQARDLEGELGLLPIAEQQEVSDVASRLSALEQRLTQTEVQKGFLIESPVSGRVASLTVREGQLATAQSALATLLPDGGKLEAQLLVPSRAAGFVEEGQGVRLLYDAFPYQKFGFHEGTVTDVSRTVINPSDLPIGVVAQEPVFIVTVDLDTQAIDAEGQSYALQSGMTLAADIILENRKIWEWILEPLLGARG